MQCPTLKGVVYSKIKMSFIHSYVSTNVYDVISSENKSKFGPAVIVSKLNISQNEILLINSLKNVMIAGHVVVNLDGQCKSCNNT